jgi:hypothetical protein
VSQPDRQLLGLCCKIKESDFPFSARKLVFGLFFIYSCDQRSGIACDEDDLGTDIVVHLPQQASQQPGQESCSNSTLLVGFHSRPRNSQVKNPAATAHC